MGYGELLLEEAREDGLTRLLETLDPLLAAARRLLGGIDAMVEFIQAGSIVSRTGMEQAAGRSERGRRPGHLGHAVRLRRRGRHRAPRRPDTILVVDDNPSSLDLLSHRLEREGHTVCSCSDGESALRASRKPCPSTWCCSIC